MVLILLEQATIKLSLAYSTLFRLVVSDHARTEMCTWRQAGARGRPDGVVSATFSVKTRRRDDCVVSEVDELTVESRQRRGRRQTPSLSQICLDLQTDYIQLARSLASSDTTIYRQSPSHAVLTRQSQLCSNF